jgi:hypothetical protein
MGATSLAFLGGTNDNLARTQAPPCRRHSTPTASIRPGRLRAAIRIVVLGDPGSRLGPDRAVMVKRLTTSSEQLMLIL